MLLLKRIIGACMIKFLHQHLQVCSRGSPGYKLREKYWIVKKLNHISKQRKPSRWGGAVNSPDIPIPDEEAEEFIPIHTTWMCSLTGDSSSSCSAQRSPGTLHLATGGQHRLWVSLPSLLGSSGSPCGSLSFWSSTPDHSDQDID